MAPARASGRGEQLRGELRRGHMQFVRLKRRADFLRAARSGRRCAMPGLVLQAVERPGEANKCVGIGFTASKKVGNAVARNRVKRRLRAAVAEVMPAIASPGQDYVVIGRQNTLGRPYLDLLADLRQALQRVDKATRRIRE